MSFAATVSAMTVEDVGNTLLRVADISMILLIPTATHTKMCSSLRRRFCYYFKIDGRQYACVHDICALATWQINRAVRLYAGGN